VVSGVTAFCAVLVLLLGTEGWQPPPAARTAPTVSQDVLESIVRLDCAFTVVASGTWSDAAPMVQISTLKPPLALSLFEIHVADGSATSESAGRRWPVSVRSDRSNLYFLDIGLDGVSRLTTVFSQFTPAGRLTAVHTRTARSAEQFYGDCAFRQ
jgi:hypothetical protein